MKKRRRLRKPIRWALRFVCYAVAAIVADLTVIGAILYYFGDMHIMAALGVCLGVNILTEYFFFKDEFRRKVVKETMEERRMEHLPESGEMDMDEL